MFFPWAAASSICCSRASFSPGKSWKRLHPFSGALIILPDRGALAHSGDAAQSALFCVHASSGPGQYHGFLWFFFINEQLLRFLNLRYPRDYNTVPRFYFWLLHLVWLFPWSVYFPAVAKLSFKPVDRAAATRLLALCWVGFVLVFFTFSTTQEYYSMPCIRRSRFAPGIGHGDGWRLGPPRHSRPFCNFRCAALRSFALFFWTCAMCRAPGDISSALSQHPNAYTFRSATCSI